MAREPARKIADPAAVISDVAHAAVDLSIHSRQALSAASQRSVAPVVEAAASVADGVVEAQSDALQKVADAVGTVASLLPPDAAIAEATAIAPSETLATSAVTARNAAKSALEQTMKSAEEFVSFGQGNLEAMMKSSQIWAAGLQDLTKSFAATAQAQLDQTVSTWKAMAGVRSVKEAMDLQTSLARSSMEAAMSETGKLTDASMKLAEQTFAPLTERVSIAVEKFSRAA